MTSDGWDSGIPYFTLRLHSELEEALFLKNKQCKGDQIRKIMNPWMGKGWIRHRTSDGLSSTQNMCYLHKKSTNFTLYQSWLLIWIKPGIPCRVSWRSLSICTTTEDKLQRKEVYETLVDNDWHFFLDWTPGACHTLVHPIVKCRGFLWNIFQT